MVATYEHYAQSGTGEALFEVGDGGCIGRLISPRNWERIVRGHKSYRTLLGMRESVVCTEKYGQSHSDEGRTKARTIYRV